MAYRPRFRLLVSAALTGVVGIVGTGMPRLAGADHYGHETHLEVAHGGHGCVLAEQDVQLQTETFGLAVVPLPNVAPTPEAASVFVLLRLSGHKIHRGRDPPTQHRERAPPFAFS